MDRKTILVLYYTRGVYPLRSTIHDHLYCWKQYSRHRTIYINVAFGFPEQFLQGLKIDAVIYHTSFCGMRWSETVFHQFTALVEWLNDHPSLKIAIPQDEFTKTDLLNDFLSDCRVDYVLTCAYESEWAAIYGDLRSSRVRFKTVLTGYLDDHTVRRARRFIKPLAQRSIDISYRAWRAAYWLGEHATHKVRVGEVFQEAGAARGLNVDISLDDSATLLGDDWLRFLADSRATVGVEGGASILDRDGSIKKRVDKYVRENPRATFEEVREACFKNADNKFALTCLSPRHLEAVATKTAQILVEGEFNGILVKDRHYIPIKPDYSDVEQALDKLADDELVQQMVDTAFREIVEPGRITYRAFVKEIEREILDVEAPARTGRDSLRKRLTLAFRDWVNWRLIEVEVKLIQEPNALYQRWLDSVRNAFVALPNW